MALRTYERKKSLTIYVDNGNIERAISKLRQIVAPKIKELKDRRYFVKPCAKRRADKKESIRNMRKAQRMRNMYY